MKTILAASLLIFLPAAGSEAGMNHAKDEIAVVKKVVKTTVDEVLAVLADQKLDKKTKKATVRKIIDPWIDYPLMAKLTLGRKHWPKLAKKKREIFTELFVEQLRTSYFDKLELFSNETVEYGKPVKKNKKFYVPTFVISKDQRIKVAYKLYNREGIWKTYDIEIEGISLIKSYSSQYHEFLRDKSFDELFAKMREKAVPKKESKASKKEPESEKDPKSKKTKSKKG